MGIQQKQLVRAIATAMRLKQRGRTRKLSDPESLQLEEALKQIHSTPGRHVFDAVVLWEEGGRPGLGFDA